MPSVSAHTLEFTSADGQADLELLAQTEAPAMTMPRVNSAFPVSTPLQGSYQSNPGHYNAPQQISRFFHRE
jgi:hypothetical protein